MTPSGRWLTRWYSPLLVGIAALVGALAFVFGLLGANGLRPPAPPPCPRWAVVNAPAFGLPAGPDGSYRGEEGFETLVFDGQLYVGMEADNTLGARLWRTRGGVTLPWGQRDWEEVIADPRGLPFGIPDLAQNDHVDSLGTMGGWLYVSTANRSGNRRGFRLFRSPTGNPGSWEPADAAQGPGFGDPANENFKSMTVFDGQLCGGTWNETVGGAVWCSRDGLHWERKSPPGFGGARVAIVWSLMAHDGYLYAGGQSLSDPDDPRDDRAFLFRTASLEGMPSWETVLWGKKGSGRALLLGALNGDLFASTRSPGGIQIWRSSGGAEGSWRPAGAPGMNRSPRNADTIVDGAAVYGGALYVAVFNPSGVEVWRTTTGRVDGWELAAPPGLDDYRTFAAVLTVFDGRLYAWTSNYVLGQSVLRAECGE